MVKIITRLIAVVVILVLAANAALFVQQWWDAMNYPYGLDYGEGPILDQVNRLVAGETVYKNDLETAPFVIANYPPGYLVAQAPFRAMFGPALWYGRLIAGGSTLLVGVFIMLVVRKLTDRWIPALIGGLTFLAVPYVYTWAVLTRVDTLALFFSWLGLAIIVWGDKRRWMLWAAGLAFVCAIYTRQTHMVAAPGTAFFWLLGQKRYRDAARLTVFVGGLVLILFLILNTLTDGGFFLNVIGANINEFKRTTVDYYVEGFIDYAPFLIIIPIVYLLFAGSHQDQRLWFAVPYLLGALVTAYTIGKVGSWVNYLLELTAAIGLLTGLLIARMWNREGNSWIAPIVIGLLAWQVWALNPSVDTGEDSYFKSGFRWHRYIMDTEAPRHQWMYRVIEETEGIVLLDQYMAMLPLQDRRIYFQPFVMTQLARDGRLWDDRYLVEEIEQQKFPLIVIFAGDGEGLIRDRWSEAILDAIDEHYIFSGSMASNRLYEPFP